VPLVVFNNTQSAGKAEVSLSLVKAAGGRFPLGFAATREHELKLSSETIQPGGQATLSFDVIAGGGCGVAKVRMSASLNGESFTTTERFEVQARTRNGITSLGAYNSIGL